MLSDLSYILIYLYYIKISEYFNKAIDKILFYVILVKIIYLENRNMSINLCIMIIGSRKIFAIFKLLREAYI